MRIVALLTTVLALAVASAAQGKTVQLTTDMTYLGTAFSVPSAWDDHPRGDGISFDGRQGAVDLIVAGAPKASFAIPASITVGGTEIKGRPMKVPGAQKARYFGYFGTNKSGQHLAVGEIYAFAHKRSFHFSVTTLRSADKSLTDRIVDTFRIVGG
jgi:hypothetical protein